MQGIFETESSKTKPKNKINCFEINENKEVENHDITNNIEASIKSAYYNYQRYLLNHYKAKLSTSQYSAIYFFIRDMAYSGMFRYCQNGNFNVPYGGIGYNAKRFEGEKIYREIKNGTNFKKVGLGLFGLLEYNSQKVEDDIKKDTVRMHSYMQGVMIEMGNYDKYDTYSPDVSATFQQNIKIGDITSIKTIPSFSYTEIVGCNTCNFVFEKFYGKELGEGFIEIHHIKPVYQYEGEDVNKTISQALRNLVPLCSNCHKMFHRKKNIILDVAFVKSEIAKTGSKIVFG